MVSTKIKMQLAMHVFTIDMAMVFTVRNIQLHMRETFNFYVISFN